MASPQETLILVPIDNFGPWAQAIAQQLVEIEQADEIRPLLLHVFDEETKQAAISQSDAFDEGTDLNTLAKSLSGVQAAGEVLDDAGFEYSTVGVSGENLGIGILNVAEECAVSRIYMHSRKRSPTGKAIFGSTIAHILSNATVPVVVLPNDATRGHTE